MLGCPSKFQSFLRNDNFGELTMRTFVATKTLIYLSLFVSIGIIVVGYLSFLKTDAFSKSIHAVPDDRTTIFWMPAMVKENVLAISNTSITKEEKKKQRLSSSNRQGRPIPSCNNGCVLLFMHVPKTGKNCRMSFYGTFSASHAPSLTDCINY
jgi:hypothetical protein